MISNHFCKKDRTGINRNNLSKQIYHLDILQDGRPKDEDAQAIDDILSPSSGSEYLVAIFRGVICQVISLYDDHITS